jgi:hypothetical protein
MTTCSPRRQEGLYGDWNPSLLPKAAMVPRARTLPAAAREHELAARVKPKGREETRARQNARHQRRRQKKNAGSTFFSFAKSILPNTWRLHFFSPLPYHFGSGKLQQMANKKCQIVGVALTKYH